MRHFLANNYINHIHRCIYLLVCALKTLLFKSWAYIFTVVMETLGQVQISIYIYVIIFFARRVFRKQYLFCVYTFWNDFYFFWTTFNTNCWTCWRLKHFFSILEPSFLISLFPQKNIRQFKDEFIEVKVAAHSIALTVLSGILSSWFKTCENIPKTTTVGR